MSDLITKKIGSEAAASLKWEGGKLRVEFKHENKMGEGGAYYALNAEQIIETIKAAIPGTVDDLILDLVLVALKKT